MLEARRELIHAEAFNIVPAGENYQVAEIAEMVEAAIPESKAERGIGAGPDIRNYRVDGGKFNETFPEAPFRWTVEKGISQLRDGYTTFDLNEDGLSRRFRRLPWINALQKEGRLGADLRWVQ